MLLILNNTFNNYSIYSLNINNRRTCSLFYLTQSKYSRLGLISTRSYSTSNNNCSSSNSNNLIEFLDADKDKIEILNLTKNRSGIYMWTNKLNGKKYVGSSVDLRRRLIEYYNANRLMKYNNMPINSALLKHGYQSFTLTILEFCGKYNIMSKEKYYFDVYEPYYNILKTPGSPSRGSGWTRSEATIENMRLAASQRSPETLAKLSEAQSSKIKVEVTDLETNTTISYHSVRATARALGIDRRYILHYVYLNQDNPVLNRYIFKLLKNNDENSDAVNKQIVQKTSKRVEVTNVVTNEVTVYPTIGATARALGYRQPSISLYLKENRTNPFKGVHKFKLI